MSKSLSSVEKDTIWTKVTNNNSNKNDMKNIFLGNNPELSYNKLKNKITNEIKSKLKASSPKKPKLKASSPKKPKVKASSPKKPKVIQILSPKKPKVIQILSPKKKK